MAETSVFECGLCWKEYDDRVHRPLSLPCGHVFCEECLKQNARKDETQCPIHRSWFPTGIKELPSCFAILVNLPRTKPRDIRCPAHPKRKLKFRCPSHRVNFCSDCVVLHSGHTVLALSDVTSKLNAQLSELIDSARTRLPALLETRRSLEQSEKKLAGFYDIQASLVRKTYDDAIAVLTSKKAELLQELKTHWSKQLRAFEIDKVKLTAAQDRLSDFQSRLSRAQSDLLQTLSIDETEALIDTARKNLSRTEDWKPGDVVVYSFQESLRVTDKSAVMRAKSLELAGNCTSKESLRAPTRAFALEGQRSETCKACLKPVDGGQRLCRACQRKCDHDDPLCFSGQAFDSQGDPSSRTKDKPSGESQPLRKDGTPRSASKPAKEVFLSLICALVLRNASAARSSGLVNGDKLGLSIRRFNFPGHKAISNASCYREIGTTTCDDQETAVCEKVMHLERAGTSLGEYSETVILAVIVVAALTFGFRLGAGNSPSVRSPLHINTYTSSPSTATNSPPTGFHQKKFLFEGFRLDDSPMTPISPIAFCTDSVPADCLETGRLASTFSEVKELWSSGAERLLVGKHTLEGKRYYLREKVVSSLEELPKDPRFQHIESRLNLQFSHFLSYVTSWVEAADDGQVKIIAQIEHGGDTSLADLAADRQCLKPATAATIFKQVLKAVHFAESNHVRGFDFAPSRIFVDSHLRVTVADFDLSKPTPTLRMCPKALEVISTLLEELSPESATPVLQQRYSC